MVDFVIYAIIGFFGLFGLLIVFALLFGHHVIKKWDYEAEFRDARGREIAELEIELSKIDKKERDFTLKVEFWMRHTAVKLGSRVQVFLDDALVLEGSAKEPGRVRFGKAELRDRIDDPGVGQLCRVICDGNELLAEPLRPD